MTDRQVVGASVILGEAEDPEKGQRIPLQEKCYWLYT
jgi:hypothetical protein